MEIINNEIDDMKICQPDEYDLSFKMVAPDERTHQGIFNKKKYKMGYIHNKLYEEDDSYYAPYLVYEIGKKIEIDVPETEIALVLHRNINQDSYMNSWCESSIVYDKMPYYSKMRRLFDNVSYVSPSVIEAEYFTTHKDEALKRITPSGICTRKKTVEDYVNAYTWYLTNHGSKPVEQYTKQEIDTIKQELIDRALFSLRYDSYGNFDIRLTDYKNAELEPYYPSRMRMYLLNVKEEKIDEYLEENNLDFKKLLDDNYELQYVSSPIEVAPTVKTTVRHIFEKYPKFAQKSYNKICKFTNKEMEELLKTCTRMSDNHKKFAMRAFETRGKEFDEIYQEYLKSQEQR